MSNELLDQEDLAKIAENENLPNAQSLELLMGYSQLSHDDRLKQSITNDDINGVKRLSKLVSKEEKNELLNYAVSIEASINIVAILINSGGKVTKEVLISALDNEILFPYLLTRSNISRASYQELKSLSEPGSISFYTLNSH